MGNGFQVIDIILFAMIAAFLILRLRGVLGRRDGNESGYRDPFKADAPDSLPDDNLVKLPNHPNDAQVEGDHVSEDGLPPDELDSDKDLARGLEKISAADKNFDEDSFLVGARTAFEVVLGAYVSGDREVLKNLLSMEVYDNFRAAIDDREKAGHTIEETLVSIQSAEVVEACIDGSQALVTTKILSEQVHVLRDGQDEVIDGNPNEIMDVVDFWTFARDMGSRDPNWQLVATRIQRALHSCFTTPLLLARELD